MKHAAFCVAFALLPGLAQAELMGVTCNFTRACNNFLACEDVDYKLTVAPATDGWVFRDDEGESPAFRMPETPGKGVVAFTSEASYDSTMMLVLYSGGPALLIDAFDEPGFFSLNGSCDVIQ